MDEDFESQYAAELEALDDMGKSSVRVLMIIVYYRSYSSSSTTVLVKMPETNGSKSKRYEISYSFYP